MFEGAGKDKSDECQYKALTDSKRASDQGHLRLYTVEGPRSYRLSGQSHATAEDIRTALTPTKRLDKRSLPPSGYLGLSQLRA